MLPLLSKLSLQPTDNSFEGEASDDDAQLPSVKALANWVKMGFVTVRPREPMGHTLQFYMSLIGTKREHTASDDNEPKGDTLLKIVSDLNASPMNVQGGNGQPLYTTEQLPTLVLQSLKERQQIVKKRLINWMKGNDDLNVFGVFRDDENHLWRLEAFQTALTKTNRGEILELLEDVLGFVSAPCATSDEYCNKYGHNRRWIRNDKIGLLPNDVLQAFKYREKRFSDASDEAEAMKNKQLHLNNLSKIFEAEAEAGRRLRQKIENAHPPPP